MENKKFKYNLFLITYGVLLFVILNNYKWFGNFLGFFGKIFSPFIIGIVIAFILNVLINIIEKKLLTKLEVGKRAISIIFSLFIVFGLIGVLLFILIPQFKNASLIFIENIPKYHETIYKFGQTIGLNREQLSFLSLENNKISQELTTMLSENSLSLISFSMGFANSIVSGLCNFFIGLVFAIYVLAEKENLMRQSKKLLKKLFPVNVYKKIIEIFSLSNNIFSDFVKVQVLEACILGFLCFLGMFILRLPYAATISVVVGFTALIPMFGAFIGCIIGAFLIFMINPVQSLIFILFFLILQQVEGNLIYPRVVGGKIGLPSIWVLVAVIIGGSVGGVFGMLLAVPIVSILYCLLKEYVNGKNIKRNK